MMFGYGEREKWDACGYDEVHLMIDMILIELSSEKY